MKRIFLKLFTMFLTAAICLSIAPGGIAQAEESGSMDRFTDVMPGQWFYSAVEFVVENGYFNGMSETSFAPDEPMTRAMFVTVLGRFAGAEVTAAEFKNGSVFEDVEPGSYYCSYVNWAVENKIVTGYSKTIFGQGDPVTREQIAVFLYRYAELIGLDTGIVNTASPGTFSGGGNISPWAMKGVTWAMQKGLMKGLANNSDHQSAATRAEVAQILMNFSKFANE